MMKLDRPFRGSTAGLPQRVDLGSLRQRILVALGPEKARKYWDTLKRFTRFTLSKEELDLISKDVLGPDNIPLHNEFIRGIFQNALLGTISPPAHEVILQDPVELGRPQKKQKKKVTPQGTVVLQGGPQAPGQGQQRRDQGGMSQDTIWINAQELHRMQWKICDGADLYDESWELPSLVGIRHKMRRRGQEHGLVVQHEAVECLHKVLEKYISNIILACKEVAEVRRSGRGVSAEDDRGYSGNISMADMQVAMKLAPELLGQEAVLNQERICLAQHV